MKILIVDDSVFSQKVTANLMKKHLEGAEMFFAKDGQEGLERYMEIRPDYMVVDLLMPRVSGKELICMVKEKDSNAKIVVVSADVQKNVRKEIESYQVMTFLNKPFDEEKAQQVCELIRNDQNV